LMDQEREKLARLAREVAELVCFSEDKDALRGVAYQIELALQQWGDLRAEQVRRETVEACARIAEEHQEHMDFAPVQDHRPDGDESYVCNVAEAVRRAFAASQGGTT
jgi:hypothetical protein